MEERITLGDVFSSIDDWMLATWDIDKIPVTAGTYYFELRKEIDMDKALEDALTTMMLYRDYLLQCIEEVQKVG
jgi:hypothetical protein